MVEKSSPKRFSHSKAPSVLHNYQEYSFEKLNLLFMQGEVPTFDQVAGETAGAIILCPQCNSVSKIMAAAFFDNPLSRWAGKIFVSPYDEDKSGRAINRYGNRLAPHRYPMLSRLVPATCDRKPCVRLNYIFPWSTFGAFDEFRKVEDGVFVGKTYQKLPFTKTAMLTAHFVLCALGKS